MKKEDKKDFRSGFVAIVGRSNVGKSTLLNNILGEKVAIVTRLPQTTRNLIRGILTEKRGQIIFIDTPGIHLSKDRLGKYMNISASEIINDVDVIIHLIDSSEKVGQEEEIIVGKLKKAKKPIILGLNKVDRGGKFIPQYIKLWEEAKGKSIPELADSITVLPISGLKNTNIKELLEELFSSLSKGELLYPSETISDLPENNMVADIIREKLMNLMRQEIPYSAAVFIEEITQRSKRLMIIKANVYIERDSQRRMVIGKKAQAIKKIGTLARQELEEIFKKKIYLDLNVVTKKSWRENPIVLKMLGYSPNRS